MSRKPLTLGVADQRYGSRTSLDVRHYGAMGDGVTDDRAAIQAAVNACYALGGGSVLIPVGTFVVGGTGNTLTDSGVLIPDGVAIVGVGPSSVLKRGDSKGYKAILANTDWNPNTVGNENITIRDLCLDGNLAGQVDSIDYAGVLEYRGCLQLTGARHVTVERVWFKGLCGDGATLNNMVSGATYQSSRCKDVTFRDCLFQANNDNRQGISVIDADGVLIDGCWFEGMTRSDMPGAIDLEPSFSSPTSGSPIIWQQVAENVRIHNCHFTGCQRAVDSAKGTTNAAVRTVSIVGCVFESTVHESLYLSTGSGYTITGNQFKDDGGSAIYLKTVNDFTVSGNTFRDQGGAGVHVDLGGTTTGSIVGNAFFGGSSSVVQITSTNNITVVGNTIRTPGGRGVFLNNAGGALIANNQILNLGGTFSAVYGLDSSGVRVADNQCVSSTSTQAAIVSAGTSTGWLITYNMQTNFAGGMSSLVGVNTVV